MPIAPNLSSRLQFPPGKRDGGLLLAISGGLDSMALLHLCVSCREELGLADLQVGHVHHGVRGADADADAELVRLECARRGLPFHLLYIDPRSLQGAGGFEKRAREARYAALQGLRSRLGLEWLATAHHQDDQAETVCLRLLRGTTLWGLQGILAARADGVVRPLLGWSRAELRQYALDNGVPWREDQSNADTDYARNRVRHRLLPTLERECPHASAQLARQATACQRLWPRLAAELETNFGTCRVVEPAWMAWPGLRPQGACLGLDWEKLRPLLDHWELFRLWLGLQGFSWQTSGEELHLRSALASGTFARMRLGKLGVEKSDGTLWWYDQRSWSVAVDNMYLFTMLRRDPGGPCARSPVAFCATLDATPLSFPEGLEVRYRKEGDRFSPPGLRSKRRKLKQWLQEFGIPAFVRDRLLVVACGGDVVWIPGFGVSGLYKASLLSTNTLELRLEWKKSP